MNCEEDKDGFQKGVEKGVIALSEESIPVNTRQKAMKKCMTELLQIIDSFNSTKGHCFTQVEHEVII